MHARFCRCGPRAQNALRAHVVDAGRGRSSPASDPTGTLPLQRQFSRALRARWQALRAMIPDAVAHTAHRINSIQIASLTGQDPIVAFQSWFDEALRQVVLGTNGSWTLNYVRQAGDRATLRASTLLQVQDAEWNESEHPRDKDGKWTENENADTAASRLDNHKDYPDVTDQLGTDGGKGFLLPNGKVISIGSDSHEGVIEKVGSSWSNVYGEGIARIIATPTDGFFGIEIRQIPTRKQIRTLLKTASSGNFGSFSIDGPPDVYLTGTPITAVHVRKALREAFPTSVKDAAPTHVADRIPTLQSLAISELQGIAEAVSQRAVRAYAEGAMRRQTAPQIARAIQQAIDTVGRKRGDLLVSFMIVRAFGAATLDALRSRGITHVGIVPEHRPAPPVVTDAKLKKKSKVKKNLVEVLTAGDDDVCPQCEEISENGPYTLDEAESLIPAHPHCLPADTLVLSRDGVDASSERWFAGELIVIETASGNFLSCTPNHPILTDRGWVAAQFLDVGDNVVSDGGVEWKTTVRPINNDYQHVPTSIHDVSRSFLEPSQMNTTEVPTASPDFHGDGMNGEVAVIRSNGMLRQRRDSTPFQHTSKFDFVVRDQMTLNFRSFYSFFQSVLFTASSIVRCFDLILAALRTHLTPLESFSFAGGSTFDFVLGKNFRDDIATDTKFVRDNFLGHTATVERTNLLGFETEHLGFGHVDRTEHPLNRLPTEIKLAHEIRNGETGPVFLDQLVSVKRIPFAGHVYNLQTPKGHYSAGGIITHNCRCAYIPADDKRFAPVRDTLADSKTHIAAGVMFLDPQGRALFVKRSDTGDHPGEWCFPGGAVEPGETLQAAAKRETLEETGHMAADVEEVDRRELDGVDFTTYVSHVPFIFEPKLNREHDAWLWAPLSNPPRPLHPGVRATVNAAVIGDAEWKEELHPRDKDGKFAVKGTFYEKIVELQSKMKKKGIPTWSPESDADPGEDNYYAFEMPASSFETDYFKGIAVELGLNYTELDQADFGEQDPDDPHTFFMLTNKQKSWTEPSAFDPEPEPAAPPALDINTLTKIGGKKGSNEGGVYEGGETGDKQQYYIKHPKTLDHVQNELTAAALYKLAGVNTMEYVPVEGGAHVATKLQALDKNNISQFNADERHEAQKDFAVHAWLANWDAAGTGGDNQVVVNGKVATVDTGGSLKYRAQGEPKGAMFGDKVTEIDTLRDPSKSPDAAALYGSMTSAQIKESIDRVAGISNQDISDVIYKTPDLATMSAEDKATLFVKLITRKQDLITQGQKMTVGVNASNIESLAAIAKAAEAKHNEPEKPLSDFATKSEYIKYKMLKGTTATDLKQKLGWKQIGMPATAASLGIKLETTKMGKEFFYKGTLMSPAEIAAAKAGTVVPITKAPAPSVAPVQTAFDPAPAPKKLDMNKPSDNFELGLKSQDVKYSASVDKAGTMFSVSASSTEAAEQVAKYHPHAQKLSKWEYYVPNETPGTPVATPKLDVPVAPKTPATQAELDKAKKNTKLTANYVPGAPANNAEAQALIDKFNEKYEGKPLSTNEELQAKVDDFKALTAAMVPLQTAQQKIEVEAQAAAKAKAAADYAKANAPPDFDAMTDEEERVYWYNKAIGSSSYMKNAQDAMHKKIVKDSGISVSEVAFIKAFTGSHSHVNANLIIGVMTPEEAAYKEIMKEALAKMPKHNGETLSRKITLTAAQQAEYEVGKVKHWSNFSSSSTNFDVWNGNTHFKIHKPKTGVDVKSISSSPGESEVIMPADTYYTVLSKKPNTNIYGKPDHGTMLIELEEYIPYKKKKKAA